MKIYENIQIKNSIFRTEFKAFHHIDLIHNDIPHDSLVIKDVRVFSPNEDLLYDEWTDSKISQIQTSNGYYWYFDYNDKHLSIGTKVYMSIKYYYDADFSDIWFVKIGDGEDDWRIKDVIDRVNNKAINFGEFNYNCD